MSNSGVRAGEIDYREHRTEFRMTNLVSSFELQSMFDRYSEIMLQALRFTVYPVRNFSRPSSMDFLKEAAECWPWDRLMIPWSSTEHGVEPRIPRSADALWDPHHARQLEAKDGAGIRILWGNAFENGHLVKNSSRHVEYLASVAKPMESLLHTALEGATSIASGVFLVHEHEMDVWFPVTDSSVIYCQILALRTYREMELTVLGKRVSAWEGNRSNRSSCNKLSYGFPAPRGRYSRES